jgi:hypothetical protein
MILEGIVTTLDDSGAVNVAPMGPHVEAETPWERFVLRPYQTSKTYRNLKGHGEGVLHITDDVWLLAQAALDDVHPAPPTFPATVVRGHVLSDACRWHEFRVTQLDDRTDRTTIECSIVHSGHLRDFFGFNRAKHAVVEAAILATRTGILPIQDILDEFRRLSVPVQKTAGPQEARAFELLLQHVHRAAEHAERASELPRR